MKYDVIADWQINMFCNFRCEYCFISNKIRQNSEYKGHNIEKIIDGFNKYQNIYGKTFWVHMSGGEPFLQPDFVKLCSLLSENHYISINTNISTSNVYDFADNIDPKRVVLIHCSLHIDERECKNLVGDFIKKYHYLKDKGFDVFATQVLYPPVLQRFDEISEYFKDNGIILKPKTFRGMYKYKYYPHGYTKKQRDDILNYIVKISGSLEPDEKHVFLKSEILERDIIKGDISFKRLLCNAGMNSVSINYDGNVIRCFGESTKIGNLFEGEINLFECSKPCMARICPCPYYGYINTNDKPKIVNDGRIKNIVRQIYLKVK